MGHWITDEDGQHLYIGGGGKVLATRSAISKASGGTERGKALAGRSKAAILKAKRAKESGTTPKLGEHARDTLAKARYIRDYDAAAGKKFPEAGGIVNRVAGRVEARYERGRTPQAGHQQTPSTPKLGEKARDLLAKARYIRDHDAAAGKKFPEAKAMTNRIAARVEARYERGRGSSPETPKPKPAGTGGDAPVKAGPQALRDMYAAQSRHKSLQGRLDAGDKGVTKEHVASAREDLKQSRIELLRTKFDQEKRQVAADAAGPGKPSLRAQADAARAGKGTREERIASIAKRVQAAERSPGGKNSGPISNTDSFAARHAATQEHYANKTAAKAAKVDAKVEAARTAKEKTDPQYAARREANRRLDAQATRDKGKQAGTSAKIAAGATQSNRAKIMGRAIEAERLKNVRAKLASMGRRDYSKFPTGKVKDVLAASKPAPQPPARAAAPGVAKATGRGTPERAGRAAYLREDRANTVAAKAALARATSRTDNPLRDIHGHEITGDVRHQPQIAATKGQINPALAVDPKLRAAALAKSHADLREQARAAGWKTSAAAQAKKPYQPPTFAERSAVAGKLPTSAPRPAATPAPARPSLREQAAAARAGKDKTGVEPRFRAGLAKDIKDFRAGNKTIADAIKNAPDAAARKVLMDRVTAHRDKFLEMAAIKAKTPVGRGGGEDIKYRAMAKGMNRGLRMAREK